eukprot:COSAG01_NODE_5947_length_3890_cov_2.530591_7_plen_102_part_01
MGTTTVAHGLQQMQQRSSNPGDYIVAPNTSVPDMGWMMGGSSAAAGLEVQHLLAESLTNTHVTCAPVNDYIPEVRGNNSLSHRRFMTPTSSELGPISPLFPS